MKQNRLFIPLVLASGVVHFEANAIQKVKQPNFVIIITDQQQNADIILQTPTAHSRFQYHQDSLCLQACTLHQ